MKWYVTAGITKEVAVSESRKFYTIEDAIKRLPKLHAAMGEYEKVLTNPNRTKEQLASANKAVTDLLRELELDAELFAPDIPPTP